MPLTPTAPVWYMAFWTVVLTILGSPIIYLLWRILRTLEVIPCPK